MRKSIRLIGLGVLAVFAIAACSAPFTANEEDAFSQAPMFARSAGGASISEYIVVANDELPAGFEVSVARLGGRVLFASEGAGVAAVAVSDARLLRRIERMAGIRSIIPNVTVNWLPGDDFVQVAPEDLVADSVDATDDPLAGLLWGLDAIDAYGAWDAGYNGEGVIVAVLDSGIDVDHPDLVANIHPASTSLVATEPFVDDLDGHGTHVAGTIAAVDNTIGVVGVAPQAQILAVKVLDGTGSGSFADVMNGILYANSAGADVINMSLGATLQRRGLYDEDGNKVANANEVSELVNAMKKIINFVHTNGSLVVTSAGNESVDSTGDAGLIHLPSDAGNTISVSATGPLGWALDPTTDLDVPAFYTNYGNAIDVAAPGGNVDFDLYTPGVFGPWVYDLVLSTYPGGWAFLAGTSMAAPHVAGVAALVIDAHDGNISPAQVMSIIARSADDLGKPGNDPYYGAGRVNAANAVGY